MQYCKRCLMPSTRPGSVFDENGICQACHNYDSRKNVNWAERKLELKRLCDKYRKSSGYDCIIPVSGGKDSHFLVYMMVKEMGMHPLLVTVTDSFTHTGAGSHNLRNTIETFKLNHIMYTINHDLFRRVTRADFEDTGEALKFIELAIYTVPTLIAQKLGIRLVVYGENSAFEYGTAKTDSYLATPVVQRMSERLDADKNKYAQRGISPEEISSIQLDKSMPLPEVIYLSYFSPWSSVTNLQIAKRYGFKDLSHEWKREGYIEDFEQIDSVAYLVHLWLKYPKFGFQRISDIASRRVREGLMTTEEARKAILYGDKILDQKSLEDFNKFLGYATDQFWQVVEKFWNPAFFEKKDGIWQMKSEIVNALVTA